MLRALRDGAKSGFLKFILLGFMALAVGGLVLTDVGGFFRGGVSSNLVAKGKGIEISTMEFDRTVRRILARQSMSPEEAYSRGFIDQIINSEIQVRILGREARKLGINVNDDTVRDQISKIAEPLATGGVSKSDALKQVLRSQGVSEGEFVASIRQEMGNTVFRNALLTGAAEISDAQAADLYQYQYESRDFEGFILNNDSVKDITPPSEESLKRYYEANKPDFAISEKRSVTIATFKKEMLEGKVDIAEDDIKANYEKNIERYQNPEKRKLEQAILSTQKEGQDVLNKINEGKSLKDAVNAVTGKTAAYLGDNTFEQGGLLEEISTPAFEAKAGDVIGPVQTALGWHVMKLQEILTPQTEDFDKVKAAIRDEMLQARLQDELIQTAETIDDQIASGADFEEVVKEFSLTTEEINNFNQAGIDDDGKDLFDQYQGDKAPILEDIYDFNVGEVTPLIELADGRFVMAHIDTVQEKSYIPFADVKEKLTQRWVAEQKALANMGRAADALTKLKDGASLNDVAKEYGGSVKTYATLVRTNAPDAPITYPALRQIFDGNKGDALQLDINNGYIIGRISAITLPDPAKGQDKIKDIKTQTSDALPQEIIAQYVNALSLKYNVRINDRILKQMYGGAVEQ